MAVKKKILLVKSFSLTELMLAAAFLTTVFLGLMACFIACFVLNEANRNLSIATTHAQYVMEEIKNTAATVNGFNTLKLSNGSQWNLSAAADFENRDLDFLSSETVTVAISDGISGQAATTLSELLRVSIAVAWFDRARSKNMVLETLIAEP